MERSSKYISCLLFILFINGCMSFEEINQNTDSPTTSTAAMQATKQLVDLLYKGSGKNYYTDCLLSKQIAWSEYMEAYQYNQFGRTGLSMYMGITNCFKMIDLAEEKDKDAYTGLALFIKAYQLFFASMSLGDIPYSEAFKGEEGIRKPKYDTQKEVMVQVLDDLDKSYLHFSQAQRPFEGDIVFDGDPLLWQKTVTAFQLKVLLYLSKKEKDTDLNIKKLFAWTVKNRPLMSSNSDNFQLTYGTLSSQICPMNHTKNKSWQYPMLTCTLVDTLKKYNDYRLFYYGHPSAKKIEEGLKEDEWEAYPAVDPSDPFEEMGIHFTDNDYICTNYRYTHLETGEPLIRLGFSEQNFLLAEACLRRWIDGDATYYYHKAIEASMKFIIENTPDETRFHHNRPITDAYIKEYLANPEIQLTLANDSFEHDLNKIITQKYVASFLHYPWETYYEYRRTGYPVLPVNPETNRNTIPDKIPVRWMYDQREYDFNKENVEKAVMRQFSGDDNVNKLIWILKE